MRSSLMFALAMVARIVSDLAYHQYTVDTVHPENLLSSIRIGQKSAMGGFDGA